MTKTTVDKQPTVTRLQNKCTVEGTDVPKMQYTVNSNKVKKNMVKNNMVYKNMVNNTMFT